MLNSIQSLPGKDADFSNLEPYGIVENKMGKGDNRYTQVVVNVDCWNACSTVPPGLAMMLKAHYNYGLKTKLVEPEALAELKEVIDALDLAANYEELEDDSVEIASKIEDAFLWLAVNWSSLWT